MKTIFGELQDHVNKIGALRNQTDKIDKSQVKLSNSLEALAKTVESLTKDISEIKGIVTNTSAIATTFDGKLEANASNQDVLGIHTDMNRAQHNHEEALKAIKDKIDEISKSVDVKLGDLANKVKKLTDGVEKLEEKEVV